VKSNTLLKALVLSLSILLIFLIFWENYAKKTGLAKDFDNDPELWALQRSKVYDSSSKQIIIIGSFRIKYDLDIPTWKKETHLKAIQPSMGYLQFVNKMY